MQAMIFLTITECLRRCKITK